MKSPKFALAALVLTHALRVVSYARETDPLSFVNAWFDALNAGDVDSAISHLADDAVAVIVPLGIPADDGIFAGKGQVHPRYEGLVSAKGVATLRDSRL